MSKCADVEPSKVIYFTKQMLDDYYEMKNDIPPKTLIAHADGSEYYLNSKYYNVNLEEFLYRYVLKGYSTKDEDVYVHRNFISIK